MADFFIFEHQERPEKIFKKRKFIEDEELNNYRFSRERLQAFAEDFRQSPYSQVNIWNKNPQPPKNCYKRFFN